MWVGWLCDYKLEEEFPEVLGIGDTGHKETEGRVRACMVGTWHEIGRMTYRYICEMGLSGCSRNKDLKVDQSAADFQ